MMATGNTPSEAFDDVGALHGQLSDVGYELPEGLSYEEWASEAPTLIRVAQSSMWWLGDWLRYGEHTYGEKYAQAINATGLSLTTLKNAQWVADRIPPKDRRVDVPFSHHKAVAALDPKPRRDLLRKVAADHLSEHETRNRVREIKANEAAGGEPAPPAKPRTLDDALRDAQDRLDHALSDHDWRLAAEARQYVAEARRLAHDEVEEHA